MMADDLVRGSITMFINYFLSIRDGNDAYSLRFHALSLIYKIADMDFPVGDFNTDDLYNLQYNYEKFCVGSTASNVELMDYAEARINAQELEKRLQQYLNKMFLALAPVIAKHGVMIDLPVK